MQCFVDGDWNGYCLAKSAHSIEVVRGQRLLNVLDVVRDAAREDGYGFLKRPRLVGVQAQLHRWPDSFSHGGYPLDLFCISAASPTFSFTQLNLLCLNTCAAVTAASAVCAPMTALTSTAVRGTVPAGESSVETLQFSALPATSSSALSRPESSGAERAGDGCASFHVSSRASASSRFFS